MDFFEIKLAEKIGNVFSTAMRERKFNRYQFIKKWCLSDTCNAVFDFDETLCSQAKSYILRTFEEEFEGNLPDTDDESPIYEDDAYWLGYILTYWHFSEGISGEQILKEYDVCKILDEYDILHTLSVKAAIEKIREDDKNGWIEGLSRFSFWSREAISW